MKTILVTLVAALAATAAFHALNTSPSSVKTSTISKSVIASFQNWQKIHDFYPNSPSELNFRLSVFNTSYDLVKKTNSQNLGYKLGLNKMAAMTDKEIRAKFMGLELENEEHNSEIENLGIDFDGVNGLPEHVDWTTSGFLTSEVQDQKDCG